MASQAVKHSTEEPSSSEMVWVPLSAGSTSPSANHSFLSEFHSRMSLARSSHTTKSECAAPSLTWSARMVRLVFLSSRNGPFDHHLMNSSSYQPFSMTSCSQARASAWSVPG